MKRDERAAPDLPNLILGTIENYDFYEIEPFLVTLGATNFDGRTCLFAGPGISRRAAEKIRPLGVEVVRYRAEFPFVSDPHPSAPKSLPDPIYIFNYRHFLYYDYLLKHGAGFANVLLTDVKDVVFQGNPFDFSIAEQIHCAMENSAIHIGDCYYTSSWIVAGYGAETLDRLRNAEISCAGTTLGPVHLMKEYLELLLDQIAVMKDAYECADQAAHNLLLHEGRLGQVVRMYNFESPILTVGTEPRWHFDEQQRLVNRDGSLVAVVHQYDRHDELTRLVRNRVRPNPFRRAAAAFLFRWKKRIGRRLRKLRRILGLGSPSTAAN